MLNEGNKTPVIQITLEHIWLDEHGRITDYDRSVVTRRNVSLSIFDGELREAFVGALKGMGIDRAREYLTGINLPPDPPDDEDD